MKLAPLQIARTMGDLIPNLTEAVWDLKPEVKAAAKEALLNACNSVENRCVVFSLLALARKELFSRVFSRPRFTCLRAR